VRDPAHAVELKVGTLTVVLPDSRAVKFEGQREGPDAVIELANFAVVRKVISGGDVGFAESYMDGDWTTPDLAPS
jgi:cyclopropane-fatty-acyl-phospholipid synthase